MSKFVLTTAIVGLLTTLTLLDTPGKAQEALVTRVYRVFDLVMPTPNYPYEGLRLQGMSNASGSHSNTAGSSGFGGGGFGGMGGGGMGGGGMGGGGFFDLETRQTLHQDNSGMGGMTGGGMGGMASSAGYSSSSYRTSPFRFTTDDLIEAIVTTIEPDSWDDVGGEGSLLMIGGKLVIRQTVSVHEQVAELLDALRSEGSAMTSVVIEAHWLLLDRATRAELVQHGNLVDSDRLKQIADDAAAQGQITCLDGQTVHLLAGNVRSLITSVIPVVGQHQPTEREGSQDAPTTEMINPRVLAQFASGMEGGMGGVSDSRHVGYQPVSQVVNFGAVLQITPAVVPQPRSILIDLQSVVVLPPQVSTPGVSFEPVIKLDQLNLVAQQFMTTIRMPMDQPVIVGGSTLQPLANGASTGDEAKRLYLVIRASTAD